MQSELDTLKDAEVDVRFYKPDEWRNLSSIQRKKCILTRRLWNGQQGGSGSDGSGNDNGKRKFPTNKQTKSWKKKIERQGRIISALKAKKKESETVTADNNNDTSEGTVKFNKGVTQQKKE